MPAARTAPSLAVVEGQPAVAERRNAWAMSLRLPTSPQRRTALEAADRRLELGAPVEDVAHGVPGGRNIRSLPVTTSRSHPWVSGKEMAEEE